LENLFIKAHIGIAYAEDGRSPFVEIEVELEDIGHEFSGMRPHVPC
jgi:hypothetical protein